MAGKISIASYTGPAAQVVDETGNILSQAKRTEDLKRARQSYGLVTSGILYVTQITGAYGWAISDYISFPYLYAGMPNFTWGLDGTPGIDYVSGGNFSSMGLPADVLTSTTDTYQPAIFVPRVIQWNKKGLNYLGCYIMVSQVNAECTEVNKVVRLHYRFEGNGTQA
jgi:hypothetical protein